MKFDFDALADRRANNSLKWDVAPHELPMWVADMDFKTAPAILAALKRKLEHGIFGYGIVPEEWYAAIIGWWEQHHHFTLQREWLTFCTGVIPAISSSVKRLTNVGDNVVVQTPVYDIFFHSIENAGRHTLENQLMYADGNYSIDWTDLAAKLSEPLTTLFILCNPHNPVGRRWSKAELARIGELCHKYHVTVIADEIHCDLTLPETEYVPFAAASAEYASLSVTCISASKAFNIAGLQSAAVIIPDEALRQKVVRGLNSDEVAEPNAFAVEAAIAAFSEGAEWLSELRRYLAANRRLAAEFIAAELPELVIASEDATYLLWLDCSRLTKDTAPLCEYIRQQTGLIVTSGRQYRGNGSAFIRINLAAPQRLLKDGLQRFKQGIESYKRQR